MVSANAFLEMISPDAVLAKVCPALPFDGF